MSEDTKERSFDELAKGLASGQVSRRKALKVMAAALLGGTLASVPGMAWAARTPPTGKGGCPQGRTLCRGKCYDLKSDSQNCGQCGNVCSQSQVCQGGTCLGLQGAQCSSQTQCASGLTCYQGTCAPCGFATCGGCCDANGKCQPGTSNTACGSDGSTCVQCDTAAGQSCLTGGGGSTCVEPQVCDSSTCPTGCCDANNVCQPGTSNTACGTGGLPCQICSAAGGEICCAGGCRDFC